MANDKVRKNFMFHLSTFGAGRPITCRIMEWTKSQPPLPRLDKISINEPIEITEPQPDEFSTGDAVLLTGLSKKPEL